MKYSDSIRQRLCGRHRKCMSLCDVKEKRILDVGCSYGWFESFAVKDGCREIVAFDPDSENLEKARKQAGSANTAFSVGSVFRMDAFKDSYFDLVVMFDVIEHIPKGTEGKALLEIRRVMKDGGELVISTPNRSFFSNLLDPMWYLGHRHYSEEGMKMLVRKAGLTPAITEKRGRFYELFSMILLYPFKWFLNMEIPFKDFFDSKRDREYLGNKEGFATLFVKSVKKI